MMVSKLDFYINWKEVVWSWSKHSQIHIQSKSCMVQNLFHNSCFEITVFNSYTLFVFFFFFSHGYIAQSETYNITKSTFFFVERRVCFVFLMCSTFCLIPYSYFTFPSSYFTFPSSFAKIILALLSIHLDWFSRVWIETSVMLLRF